MAVDHYWHAVHNLEVAEKQTNLGLRDGFIRKAELHAALFQGQQARVANLFAFRALYRGDAGVDLVSFDAEAQAEFLSVAAQIREGLGL